MKLSQKVTYGVLGLMLAFGASLIMTSDARAQSTFASDYSITVPAGSQGGTASLDYEYSGSDSLTTCSDTTVSVTIPQTASTLTGTVNLINVPTGTTNNCEYTATISGLPADLSPFAPQANIDNTNPDFAASLTIINANTIGNGVVTDTFEDPSDMNTIVTDIALEQSTDVWKIAGFVIATLLGLTLAILVIRKVIGRFRRIGSAG